MKLFSKCIKLNELVELILQSNHPIGQDCFIVISCISERILTIWESKKNSSGVRKNERRKFWYYTDEITRVNRKRYYVFFLIFCEKCVKICKFYEFLITKIVEHPGCVISFASISCLSDGPDPTSQSPYRLGPVQTLPILCPLLPSRSACQSTNQSINHPPEHPDYTRDSQMPPSLLPHRLSSASTSWARRALTAQNSSALVVVPGSCTIRRRRLPWLGWGEDRSAIAMMCQLER